MDHVVVGCRTIHPAVQPQGISEMLTLINSTMSVLGETVDFTGLDPILVGGAQSKPLATIFATSRSLTKAGQPLFAEFTGGRTPCS